MPLLATRMLGCDPTADDDGSCAITEDEFWDRTDAAQETAHACPNSAEEGPFSTYYLNNCALDEFNSCEATKCVEGWETDAASCVAPTISAAHCYETYGAWGCAGEP